MKIIYIISIFLIGLIFVMPSYDAYGFVSIDWTIGGGVFGPQPALPGASVPSDPYPILTISQGTVVPAVPTSIPVSVQVDLSNEPIWFNGIIDTIDVLVTSVDNPSGTTYTLTETGIATGMFTGTNFVFIQGNHQFQITDVITVTINDPTCIPDGATTQLDSTSGGPNNGVKVYSDTDTAGLGLVLTETGDDTCEFSGKLRFSSNPTDELTGTLQASLGDILTFEDSTDLDYLNAQIIPTVNGKGSILANFDDPDFDYTPEVLVTYNGNMAGLDLNDDGAGGRGGGGLVKPGLVIDFVAILLGGGGGSDSVPPTIGLDKNQKRIVDGGFSFNGNAVDVEQFYTPYPLITTEVGKLNTIKLKIYENRDLDNIAHVGVSYGLGKGEYFNEGRATIEYDRTFDGIESVTLFDPKHVLGSVNVTTATTNCSILSNVKCLEVTFDHIFRKSLDYNMVATNIWDFKRNGWQNYFNHGIKIIGDSMDTPEEYSGIYEGHIYHLTSTGKNTAIDDYGYTWTFDKIWNRDYVKIEKPDHDILNPEKIHAIEYLGYDSSDAEKIFGFDRFDHRFYNDKNQQILTASDTMNVLCSECKNKPYENIDHTFSYSFTSKTNKLTDPLIAKQMIIEEQKAQTYLDGFFEKIYPSKVND